MNISNSQSYIGLSVLTIEVTTQRFKKRKKERKTRVKEQSWLALNTF